MQGPLPLIRQSLRTRRLPATCSRPACRTPKGARILSGHKKRGYALLLKPTRLLPGIPLRKRGRTRPSASSERVANKARTWKSLSSLLVRDLTRRVKSPTRRGYAPGLHFPNAPTARQSPKRLAGKRACPQVLRLSPPLAPPNGARVPNRRKPSSKTGVQSSQSLINQKENGPSTACSHRKSTDSIFFKKSYAKLIITF